MKNGGISLFAMKGWGKTRMLFSMAQELRNLADCRVLIFDPSMAWLYNFSKIPVFNVNIEDITAKEQKSIEDIEQYTLNNFQVVKMALESNKDLLFRLKSRKPSIRGFFIRQIILYLDSLQRAEIERNLTHEPKKSIAYFIEEFQDCFNNRSTARNDSEEFQAVFNECRNMKEAFFTCSQRETDCSKTLRSKQLILYGKIPECDKSPYHRRLERQFNVNFSNLPQRNWIYNGKTIISPNWIQQGKPFIINKLLRAKYSQTQPKTQAEKWKSYNPLKKAVLLLGAILTAGANSQPNSQEEKEETDTTESELDEFMTDSGSVMFPTDDPENDI
ncbi:MAG: hypothetical protein ABSD92_04350 [Candidatus Bathyarchaeia archaeon]